MKGALKFTTDGGLTWREIDTIKGEDGKNAIASVVTKTLTSGGWSGNKQTISVTGITASNNLMATPVPASFDVYSQNGIYASAQGANTLTFTCGIVPTSNVDVNILILN